MRELPCVFCCLRKCYADAHPLLPIISKGPENTLSNHLIPLSPNCQARETHASLFYGTRPPHNGISVRKCSCYFIRCSERHLDVKSRAHLELAFNPEASMMTINNFFCYIQSNTKAAERSRLSHPGSVKSFENTRYLISCDPYSLVFHPDKCLTITT